MGETHDEKLKRVLREEITLAPYDPAWPRLFSKERDTLHARFGPDLIGRIEHFGSTAVPGLLAKPIIDMLVEVSSLDRARAEIAPILEAAGYEYFWRPTHGDDGPPFYAWFIKRDARGRRTHHLHMVEPDFVDHWRRLIFRDYLIAHPDRAAAYAALKQELAATHRADRAAYTAGKTRFIQETMSLADSRS
jgi:GrpB-like predicted nucleotidyltransferase (UPF0157 family)